MSSKNDYKNFALQAAEDFGYSQDVIQAIKDAKTSREISRILEDARHNDPVWTTGKIEVAKDTECVKCVPKINGNTLEVVGRITFRQRVLCVYNSLDEPLFKAMEIARIIDYKSMCTTNMLKVCMPSEIIKLPVVAVGNKKRMVNFVTESGLYRILSHKRKKFINELTNVICEGMQKLREERKENENGSNTY